MMEILTPLILLVAGVGVISVPIWLIHRLRRRTKQLAASNALLQQQSDGLRRAEDLYRFLIRHLPNTSVFLFDGHFRHLVADGSILGKTLPTAAHLEGMTLWEVFPRDVARTLEPFYQHVFTGNPIRVEQLFRTRIYQVDFLPIRSPDGTVEMGMAVFVDVTNQKNIVETLQDRTHDLERSNRDLAQFANVASHELKAPLRRISGFAELLAEEYEGLLADDADEYIHHILDGVLSLQSVIESLLAYSRVQTNRAIMGSVDLNDAVSRALRNLQPMIKEAGAHVAVGTLPCEVIGDPTLLRQLFENLIGNAIKFNTTGRTPQVQVTARRDLVEWEIHVADNGPGLDVNFQEKAFTMFNRIRTDVEGTGIGLALCKKIVGIHRGKIWYESEGEGKGTVFKFRLSARAPTDVSLPPFKMNG